MNKVETIKFTRRRLESLAESCGLKFGWQNKKPAHMFLKRPRCRGRLRITSKAGWWMVDATRELELYLEGHLRRHLGAVVRPASDGDDPYYKSDEWERVSKVVVALGRMGG